MSNAAQASFSIEKIYLKDASLESPLAPNVFLQAEAPQLEIQVGQQAQQFADTLYEVTITVTATARVGEKTQFLVEVAQAGIFAIQGVPEAELDALLGIGCPTVLYPYAREAISDLVTRAGFPPVVLAPMSFEALYLQRQQQAQAAAVGAGRDDTAGRIELAS